MQSWIYEDEKLNREIARILRLEMKWHAWNKDRNYSNYSHPEIVKFFLNGNCDRVVVFGSKFHNGKRPVIEMSNCDLIIETWWRYCQHNGQMINQNKLDIEFIIE